MDEEVLGRLGKVSVTDNGRNMTSVEYIGSPEYKGEEHRREVLDQIELLTIENEMLVRWVKQREEDISKHTIQLAMEEGLDERFEVIHKLKDIERYNIKIEENEAELNKIKMYYTGGRFGYPNNGTD